MGWEEATSRIRDDELAQWFGTKSAFCVAQSEGAGERSIRAFLGGAFARGHGVRDALAILNRQEVASRIAGRFTNLSQARAFASATRRPPTPA